MIRLFVLSQTTSRPFTIAGSLLPIKENTGGPSLISRLFCELIRKTRLSFTGAAPHISTAVISKPVMPIWRRQKRSSQILPKILVGEDHEPQTFKIARVDA